MKSYTPKNGFTVIELIVVIVLLALAGVLVFSQKRDLEAAHNDQQRKVAINSIYYGLEESFYKSNQYYPPSVDESVLMTVTPELFTDPSGLKINQAGSDYRYDAIGCVDQKCRGYRLSADLENEADFIKTNR